MNPTYKIIYVTGPYWEEQSEFIKFKNDDEADAYCDALYDGGARKATWLKVVG